GAVAARRCASFSSSSHSAFAAAIATFAASALAGSAFAASAFAGSAFAGSAFAAWAFAANICSPAYGTRRSAQGSPGGRHPPGRLVALLLTVKRAVARKPLRDAHHLAPQHLELGLDACIPHSTVVIEHARRGGDRHDVRDGPRTQGSHRELHRV